MQKIIEWLANGDTGLSSETMAFMALGVVKKWSAHPHDPSDFNRCLMLLEAEPMVRDSFPKLRELSPQWAVIIDHWDELRELFIDEAGLNWSKKQSATKTYDRMCELRDGVKCPTTT